MNTHDTKHENRTAIKATDVVHRYGEHLALDHLQLEVFAGEIFAILGPNGSGKTTFFRLISTLLRVQSGSIAVFGDDTNAQTSRVREHLGIVFQSPSLDVKLTVRENLRCQAALYGISGSRFRERSEAVLKQLGLTDRANEFCGKLSGGLKRRVELAKGLLHQPRLLLLDEPSTGLDPAARLDFWHALEELRRTQNVTIVLTTHLLEEADKADRIAILHKGKTVAVDAPVALRRELGGEVISIATEKPSDVMRILSERFQLQGQFIGGQVRVNTARAIALVGPVAEAVQQLAHSISVGQPSLEDVFIARTGQTFWDQEPKAEPRSKKSK